MRALAQLPLASCPMAHLVVQPKLYMPKILAYIKKGLQVRVRAGQRAEQIPACEPGQPTQPPSFCTAARTAGC